MGVVNIFCFPMYVNCHTKIVKKDSYKGQSMGNISLYFVSFVSALLCDSFILDMSTLTASQKESW